MLRLLTLLWCADTLIKSWLIQRFFARPAPPLPSSLPTITLIQPITQGVHQLEEKLHARRNLSYPHLQHIWVIDAADATTRQICVRVSVGVDHITTVSLSGERPIASKIAKMQAALPYATGDILWFLDDDVTLDDASLPIFLRFLAQSNVGAVFGLARYTNWNTPWAALMSGFVNANALPSYITLAALSEPYTITGHCFALPKAVFEQIGGLNGMDAMIGDDHELARRIRAHGFRIIQTPLVYTVDNAIPTATAYFRQIRRWFIFPRELMLPALTSREQLLSSVGSIGLVLPPVIAVYGFVKKEGWWPVLVVLLHLRQYRWMERVMAHATTPRCWLPLIALRLFTDPLVILWASTRRSLVHWRGQQIIVQKEGKR